MAWSLSTRIGTVAWTENGLEDDTAGLGFTEWAKTAGPVAASPTGPDLEVDLGDEVSAWWAAVNWAAEWALEVTAEVPPEDPAPWMADLPPDADY